MRYAEIGDDGGERVTTLVCNAKHFDPAQAAVGDTDLVSVLLEHSTQGFQNDGVIVHNENAQRLHGLRSRRRFCAIDALALLGWENEANRRALADFAVNLNLGTMTLDHAVNHRQAKAGPARALGCKEEFQAAIPRGLVHADSGVDHFDLHVVRYGSVRAER